ncbi:HAMP domain-containing sensor histidine kinase [Pseudoduganella violaceinigra]|uniref:HAMP domain-containing sensor histidine kinase n=1 Tax=Pseudoduganella violaceinigra TaxID=246602 RepID=UPI0004215389|nr:HAMP domain-containing sensor histidine kinase [Pseudoduganella violaceinigra]
MRSFGDRMYVRIYATLIACIVLAVLLFGYIHFWFAPPRHMPRNATMAVVALLLMIAVVIAAGAYPVVRWITRRLERLQASVQAWGRGDLAARVIVEGRDEVAQLAASFNDSAARVQALVVAQKSLLANASHELRSPLARIRMAVELLQDSASPAMRQELARNISELDQLIDELLLASRLDALPAGDPADCDVDFTGIVAEECARVGAVLEGVSDTLRGDATLLRRMVRNLLENALRHGGDAEVGVQLLSCAGKTRLDVCDKGAGVPASERDRIFEPFYRLPGASEKAGGVGLGLSLVRQIARRHGGEVECLPNGERGACFRITLPSGGRPSV